MAATGGVNIPITGNASGLKKSMSSAQAATKRFGKSTVNLNRKLKKLGGSMTKMGKSMSMSLTAPLAAMGGLAVKTFADFEQEMAKVKAVSGATGKEFKALEKLAQDLGGSTRFTASEVAALQLNYSKLGFVPAEIQKITGATLNLALASGEDLANSAEVAGATLRGLKIDVAEMPRVVDVMAASFASSGLDLEAFRESMKLVAPTAKATGRDLETTTAMLGILANNNIKGSMAGTQLNRVFIELNKKGLTLEQALDKVANSSNGLSTATDLVKDRGAKALLILAEQREELGTYHQSLQNVKGSAKSMAAIMDNTLQGSLLKVKSALEGAGIELGQILAPAIKKVGEFIAKLAAKFQELSPRQKKMIVIVGALVAAIGPLLVALGFLASVVLPAIGVAFTTALGPIGLIIVGIAAIATAIYVFWDDIVSAFMGAKAAIMMIGKNIANGFRKIPSLMFDAWKEFPKAILDSFKDLGKLIKAVITGDWQAIPDILKSGAKNLIKSNPLGGLAIKLGSEFGVGVADEFVSAFQSEMKSRAKEVEKEVELPVPEVGTAVGDTTLPGVPTAPSGGGEKKDVKKKVNEQAEAYKKVMKAMSDATATARLFGDAEVTIAKKMEMVRSGIEGAVVDFGANSKAVQALKVEYDILKTSLTDTIAEQERLKELASLMSTEVTGAFEMMATNLVGALKLADDGFGRFVKGLIGTVTKLISMMLAQSISQSIAGATTSGTATGPAAIFATPAFIATAVGGVLAAFAAIPKFAKGGLVSGPTMGMMGEYAGAKSNPEVIAPLDKLQGMMGGGRVEFVIEGDKLRGVLANTNSNSQFTSPTTIYD